MTSGIKAPRGAVLSPVQSAVGRKICMLAFLESFDKTEEVVYPTCKLNHLCFWIGWTFWQHCFESKLDFELAIPQVSLFFSLLHSLSKYIKAHFIEIVLRTAVHHALWLIMQIYSTHTLRNFLFITSHTLMHVHSCICCCSTDKRSHSEAKNESSVHMTPYLRYVFESSVG